MSKQRITVVVCTKMFLHNLHTLVVYAFRHIILCLNPLQKIDTAIRFKLYRVTMKLRVVRRQYILDALKRDKHELVGRLGVRLMIEALREIVAHGLDSALLHQVANHIHIECGGGVGNGPQCFGAHRQWTVLQQLQQERDEIRLDDRQHVCWSARRNITQRPAQLLEFEIALVLLVHIKKLHEVVQMFEHPALNAYARVVFSAAQQIAHRTQHRMQCRDILHVEHLNEIACDARLVHHLHHKGVGICVDIFGEIKQRPSEIAGNRVRIAHIRIIVDNRLLMRVEQMKQTLENEGCRRFIRQRITTEIRYTPRQCAQYALLRHCITRGAGVRVAVRVTPVRIEWLFACLFQHSECTVLNQ
mmetsp:Transcript_55329/g.91893  ORF Transcript_55329/g.91893 Transcript_55329/m.91893 type:complete len:359 (+) Transcript_55329:567-1643(+)